MCDEAIGFLLLQGSSGTRAAFILPNRAAAYEGSPLSLLRSMDLRAISNLGPQLNGLPSLLHPYCRDPWWGPLLDAVRNPTLDKNLR